MHSLVGTFQHICAKIPGHETKYLWIHLLCRLLEQPSWQIDPKLCRELHGNRAVLKGVADINSVLDGVSVAAIRQNWASKPHYEHLFGNGKPFWQVVLSKPKDANEVLSFVVQCPIGAAHNFTHVQYAELALFKMDVALALWSSLVDEIHLSLLNAPPQQFELEFITAQYTPDRY